jgi:coenzyme F420-reducing hydrogenase delta subunit
MSKQPLKIFLFCCSSNFSADELVESLKDRDDEFKSFTLPCSGKLDILYLTKAFETGADGAAIVTCKPGECRYLEGNLRAQKRAQAVESLLEEIGMDKGRTTIIQMTDKGIEHTARELDAFCARIKALPAIPVV